MQVTQQDPKLPGEEPARRTHFHFVLLDLDMAAWKPELLSGFAGANELRNLTKSYHAATAEPAAGKQQAVG